MVTGLRCLASLPSREACVLSVSTRRGLGNIHAAALNEFSCLPVQQMGFSAGDIRTKLSNRMCPHQSHVHLLASMGTHTLRESHFA